MRNALSRMLARLLRVASIGLAIIVFGAPIVLLTSMVSDHVSAYWGPPVVAHVTEAGPLACIDGRSGPVCRRDLTLTYADTRGQQVAVKMIADGHYYAGDVVNAYVPAANARKAIIVGLRQGDGTPVPPPPDMDGIIPEVFIIMLMVYAGMVAVGLLVNKWRRTRHATRSAPATA